MSHHPSSAELSAFRRTFIPPHMVDSMHPSDGGAIKGWPNELRDGIGYRESDPVAMCIVRADGARHTGSVARERASALRSRAYARGIGSLADRETFAPSPWAVPFLDIPGDAGCDCGTGDAGHILASDTWTEDDAPRSPLPIRYQPGITTAEVLTVEEHNGWKNRETWQADLWISNDEGLYRLVLVTIEANGKAEADAIRLTVEGYLENVSAYGDGGLLGDIIGLWLDRVDWPALAESYADWL